MVLKMIETKTRLLPGIPREEAVGVNVIQYDLVTFNKWKKMDKK
jgi:hypothetical protein